MKKSFFTIAFFLLAFSAFAQKKLTEGIINYDIVINTGSSKPEAADFLDGATTTVFIKGPKSRTEMVSSLGTQATIIDDATNTIAILKDYGTQKYMINLTPANLQEMNAKYSGTRFTLTDDTKTIIGYTCKKATGKLEDGTPVQVWYTPDVVPANKSFNVLSASLPGLPMEFESVMGSTTIKYTASKITFTAVPAVKFDLPRTGYRQMTYEESKRGN